MSSPGADTPCCKATTLLAVAATSIVVCFILVVVFLFLRFLQHHRRWRRTASLPQQQYRPKLVGLDAAAIALIPSFPYRRAGADGAVRSTSGPPAECVVCLNILDEGQMARELPSCKHVFHQECIDVWLASRASCPVCRGKAEPVRAGEERGAAAPASSARVVAVEMFVDDEVLTSSSTPGEAERAPWTRPHQRLEAPRLDGPAPAFVPS